MIANLSVLPSLRRQGTGTALLRAAEHRISERGGARVALGVAEDNVAAGRLYARLGYVSSGLRSVSRYSFPDDNGVMREIVEHDVIVVKDISTC